MAEQEKDKKIIIDEDWKNQAQQEKEKLAELQGRANRLRERIAALEQGIK